MSTPESLVTNPTSNPVPTAVSALLAAPPAELAASLERVRPELEALPEDEVGRITTNVPSAVTIVLGAAHNVAAMRDEIVRKLPEHDLAPLDKLRDYALALLFAHIMTLPSAEIETRLQALLAEAGTRRAQMLGVAEAYVPLGLVDAERVAAIRRGSGHLDTAQDLIALAQLYHAHQAELAGKTPFSAADLEHTHALGLELFDLLGRRKVGNDGSGGPGAYEQARLRAFRLMVRAYDAARAAVGYLRWREGDAETFVPSLFGGRRRRASETERPEGEPGSDGAADPNATGTQ
jgi:hypothetical protein